MSVETIVARYGLVALFAGAGLEGETVVLTGGWMAQRGLVPLAGAIAAVAAGSFVADQLYFQAGRRFRNHPRVRRVKARPAFARALALFARHPVGFIFAFRFIYGLRVISPIAIGTTDVDARLYVVVNLIAAAIWATIFTMIGYMFGNGVQRVIERINMPPLLIAAIGVVVIVAAGWWWRRRTHPRG